MRLTRQFSHRSDPVDGVSDSVGPADAGNDAKSIIRALQALDRGCRECEAASRRSLQFQVELGGNLLQPGQDLLPAIVRARSAGTASGRAGASERRVVVLEVAWPAQQFEIARDRRAWRSASRIAARSASSKSPPGCPSSLVRLIEQRLDVDVELRGVRRVRSTCSAADADVPSRVARRIDRPARRACDLEPRSTAAATLSGAAGVRPSPICTTASVVPRHETRRREQPRQRRMLRERRDELAQTACRTRRASGRSIGWRFGRFDSDRDVGRRGRRGQRRCRLRAAHPPEREQRAGRRPRQPPTIDPARSATPARGRGRRRSAGRCRRPVAAAGRRSAISYCTTVRAQSQPSRPARVHRLHGDLRAGRQRRQRRLRASLTVTRVRIGSAAGP